VRGKDRRDITWEEHRRLVAIEKSAERRDYLELLWHVGAAQTDLASLTAADIAWPHRTLTYFRRKTGEPCVLRYGPEMEAILKRLPATGPLFPELSKIDSGDRARWFGKRCRRLKISGVTLHSYRYAWAERAMAAGYPERYAQESLGHRSATVHRSYAKKARVELPPLEEFERAQRKVVPMPTTTETVHVPSPAEAEKWTPKLRPAAKLDFARSARHEKEQIDEAKTQTVQWRLQGQGWPGGDDRNQNERADRARVSGASAAGDAVEKGAPRSHA
jgi:hypothetical protein